MLILFFLRLFFYLSQFSSYPLILRGKVEICRSIAHKHKDLHAQTSHQAQTSHHWRGISFHWKCLFILTFCHIVDLSATVWELLTWKFTCCACFRLVRVGGMQCVEIYPGDGSVIVSQGRTGHFFQHTIPTATGKVHRERVLSETVKSFLFVGHIILCFLLIWQSTNSRSQPNIFLL